jgi:hypothetical protein
VNNVEHGHVLAVMPAKSVSVEKVTKIYAPLSPNCAPATLGAGSGALPEMSCTWTVATLARPYSLALAPVIFKSIWKVPVVESLARKKNCPLSCAALLVFANVADEGCASTGLNEPTTVDMIGVIVTDPTLGGSLREYRKT